MSNLILSWPNRADGGTLSGGGWSPTLPLTNMQTRLLSQVAGSTDLALANTQFDTALDKARPIRFLALCRHNLSLNGRYRIRASNVATTNLTTYSEQFDNAVWALNAATISPNVITAPDGNATADKLVESATNAEHIVSYSAGMPISSAASVTGSLHMRYAGRNAQVRIQNANGAFGICYANIDLQAGTVLASGVIGIATLQSVSLVRAANGFFRVVITGLFDATVTALTMSAYAYNSGTSYTGDGSSGFYLWGAQLEQASAASTYLPTNSAPVTRNGDFSAPLYDSGWKAAWLPIYNNKTLIWASENWWSGQPLKEDIATYPSIIVQDAGTPINAQYWRFEFSDTTNAAGYIQIGRVWMSANWQPTNNMTYGAASGWEDISIIDTSLSGVEYYDKRPVSRVFTCDLDFMSDDEGFGQYLDMQRKLGTTGEVLVVRDVSNSVTLQSTSFLGRMRKLTPLQQYAPGLNKGGFEIKELI